MKQYDYIEIGIRNKHLIIKTVNDSTMKSYPFKRIKIIDNGRILINR